MKGMEGQLGDSDTWHPQLKATDYATVTPRWLGLGLGYELVKPGRATLEKRKRSDNQPQAEPAAV